ncbi:gas vesicle accessory protein GvpU [Stenotrophomonas nematodicola]|uniref:Gas vesicle accessory protein GvpU n=1 Tax=Stenotrophomonas nematodicola TaxID=2656746 RepID=A0ABW7D1R5_9GAMM
MSDDALSVEGASDFNPLVQEIASAMVEVGGLGVDDFLQSIVNTVNLQPNYQLPVTLYLGGSLVSGQLISGDRYFEEMAELLSRGTYDAEHERELTRASVNEFGDKYRKAREDQGEQDGPVFIHLREASVFGLTGSPIPSNPVLWRGRINAVSGFHIGSLRVSAPG